MYVSSKGIYKRRPMGWMRRKREACTIPGTLLVHGDRTAFSLLLPSQGEWTPFSEGKNNGFAGQLHPWLRSTARDKG